MKRDFKIVLSVPAIPKNETNPSAIRSDGIHKGTVENERRIFFPGKSLFAVKNAAKMPIKSAITVEQRACATVNALTKRRFCTVLFDD